MNDFDRQCDATLEAARRNIAESQRLADECAAAFRARSDWEEAHGIDRDTRRRFFDALSPEDRKKVDEEDERFQRELAHDREPATGIPAKPGGGKRRRYV